MKRIKAARAWAGVVDGRIAFESETDTYGTCRRAHVYASRAEARKRFQRVVRVVVAEVFAAKEAR